jgi:hypothetical protein
MAIKCEIKPEYVALAKAGKLADSYAPRVKEITNKDRYPRKPVMPTLGDLHKWGEYSPKNNSESNDDEFEETEEDED